MYLRCNADEFLSWAIYFTILAQVLPNIRDILCYFFFIWPSLFSVGQMKKKINNKDFINEKFHAGMYSRIGALFWLHWYELCDVARCIGFIEWRFVILLITCQISAFTVLWATSVTKTHKNTFFNVDIIWCYKQIHQPMLMYLRSWSIVLSSLVVGISTEVCTYWNSSCSLQWK